MIRKTDNGDMRAKLELRRHFLRAYHASEPSRVIDCCAGSGRIWSQLRREFVVASYWPIDVKPQKGRLKIDSARVIGQQGWTEDVVDIDAYGSPWKHWLAMLPAVDHPCTVFLTIGRGGPNRTWLGRPELDAIGLTIERVRGMRSPITHRLTEFAIGACLGRAITSNLRVVECRQAAPDGNARYIGIRLEPKPVN